MKRVILTVTGLLAVVLGSLALTVPASATGGHPPCQQAVTAYQCPSASASPSMSKPPSTSPSASASVSTSPSGSKSPSASPSTSKAVPSASTTSTPAPVVVANTLPLTGPPVWVYGLGGLLLVAAGAALVVASRRRRRVAFTP